MEKKYLIKDIAGENNPNKIDTNDCYMQRKSYAIYSSSVGTAILDELPHFISEQGDIEHMVITSDDPAFQKILLKSAGELEKKLKKINRELNKKEKQVNRLTEALSDDTSKRYLIRSKYDYSCFLKTESFNTYSKDPSKGIHAEIPSYIEQSIVSEQQIIPSTNTMFNDILKSALFGYSNIMGAEQIVDNLKYKKKIAELNFGIISDILKTGDSQKLKEYDESLRKSREMFHKLCKD